MKCLYMSWDSLYSILLNKRPSRDFFCGVEFGLGTLTKDLRIYDVNLNDVL